MPAQCRFCQGPTLEVRRDLYRCLCCGAYFGGSPSTAPLYRYVTASDVERVRERAAPVKEAFKLSDGEWRLANAVGRLLSRDPERQNHFRDGLISVFSGKMTMEEWRSRTGVETGMKEVEILEILHDEMGKIPELMRDPDYRAVRKKYGEEIELLRRYYPR